MDNVATQPGGTLAALQNQLMQLNPGYVPGVTQQVAQGGAPGRQHRPCAEPCREVEGGTGDQQDDGVFPLSPTGGSGRDRGGSGVGHCCAHPRPRS